MTKPSNAYVGSEEKFQVSAIEFVRRALHSAGHPPECAMHVPNGGARSAIVGAKLKAAGVVRGYPDIMVFAAQVLPPLNRRKEVMVPRCGLALELRVWPNKPSKDQQRIHDLLRDAGWRVVTCWSLDEVIAEANRYLGCGQSTPAPPLNRRS